MEKEVEIVKKPGLSDEQKDKIAKKVKAKLEKEAQDKAEAEYEQQLIAEARQKEFFNDAEDGTDANGKVPVYIDLPKVADCIRLDGKAFYPQKIYYVTLAQLDVINETMWRGKEHEDSINGKGGAENRQRRTSNAIVR